MVAQLPVGSARLFGPVQLYTTVMPGDLEDAFSDVTDQDLWIAHLVLVATTQYLEVGNLAMQLTGAEIVRRAGEDASERASQLFTRGHFTHAEMIAYVKEYWDEFGKTVNPPLPDYVQGLQEATQEELAMAVKALSKEQRNLLRSWLGGAE